MTVIKANLMSNCGRAALLATLLWVVVGQTEAGVTITAGGVSLAAVQSAVSSAADGDTVVVPPGTGTWSSTLNVTKNISLVGAGVGQTVIIDQTSTTTNHITLLQLAPAGGTT